MRFKILKQGGYGSGGISETGGNLSGPLVLAGHPTEALHGASKGYVDTALGALNAASLVTGIIPVERLPAFTGDITNVAGSNSFALSESGITPGTYPKVTVNTKGRITNGYLLSESDLPDVDWNKITTGKPTTMAGYGITDAISPSGGTMSGDLSVTNQPTAALHIANKAYIDGIVAGNTDGSFKVGDIVRKVTASTPPGFLRCNGGEVSQTTYSALFEVLKDTYATKVTLDYTSYIAMGAGRPWNQQYDFRDTTVGANVNSWTAGTNLPVAINNHHVIVTKNRAFMLAGSGGGTNIYTATIDTDGVIGAWSVAGNLPGERYRCAIWVTKNRLFLAGGNGSTGTTTTMISAPINADGTIGSWTSSTLPKTLEYVSAFVTKSRVYLFPGNSANKLVATINEDGTLGAWTDYTDASGHSSISYGCLFATKNRVYLVGGTVTTAVRYAPVNADGTIGTWATEANSLPLLLSDMQCFVTKNRVFLIGGYSGSSYISAIYSAPIASDGSVGAWSSSTTTLPQAIFQSALCVTKTRVYLLGGQNSTAATSVVYYSSLPGTIALNDYTRFYNGMINKFDGSDITGEIIVHNDYPEAFPTQPGSGRPWQQQYFINTTQSADFASWSSGGTLPSALTGGCAFVTKDRAYLVGGGGSGGSVNGTIYTATISSTGVLSSWTASSVTIPVALKWIQGNAFVTRNRVYIAGGHDGTSSRINVYMATINADGTITSFTAVANNLPGAAWGGCFFVTKNYVYAVGTFTTAIYAAPINADGTLGVWDKTTAPALPQNLGGPQVIVTKKRVYVLGGAVSGTEQKTVYTAVINTDGTLGAWSTATSLPAAMGYHYAYATSTRVWVWGGNDGTGNFPSRGYTAPIDSNGVIGAWTTATGSPSGSGEGTILTTSTRVYVLGGVTGSSGTTFLSSQSFANMTGGLNNYSGYYDGTITPSEAGTFRLPDYSAKEMPGSYSYIKA